MKTYTIPTPLKAGDKRVEINGQTPKVECRIVAEELYQALVSKSDIKWVKE